MQSPSNIVSPSRDFLLFPILSQHCSGVLAGFKTHLGHNGLASEASPDGIVDTLGLPPALTNALEAVTLVTLELRGALLDDRDVLLCGNHLCGLMLVFGILEKCWRRENSSRNRADVLLERYGG
jgi:hypothetical protein